MKKFLAGIAVGIAVLVLGGVALLVFWTSPLPDISVDVPASAELGGIFTVTIVAANPHPEPIALDNVDIPNRFFDAFEVLSVVPRATSDSPLGGFGTKTWYFDIDIPPMASATVVFELRAIAEGRHVVEFEVCNSTEDCSPVVKFIEVK